MPTATLISTLLLLPFSAFVLNGLLGRSLLRHQAGWLSTGCMLLSFVLAAYVAYDYFWVSGKINGVYTAQLPWSYEWLRFSSTHPGYAIKLGFVLDPLSVMMLVVVTLISLMVHIFSLWYMKGEERFAMYYGYLGLFSFSMLGLVLSSNIFQLYMCWELVGLSSFLLIGYYYAKPAAVAAAKKAFIVTRFADFGFLIGILILSYYSGSFDFKQIITALTDQSGAAFSSSIAHSFIGISALSWG
ncbi:MAG TPA: proton-conducting transporter membrane subunit, partial [Ferruginibacter sp.]|nr:proton-conducting transporter membrane subunit [Ferruginibacter sp.]